MFKDVTYTCKYKYCNMVFETQYRLDARKKNKNHFLRRKRGKDNGNADEAVLKKKRKKATETITSFFKGRNSDEVGGNQKEAADDGEVSRCQSCNELWEGHDDDGNRCIVCDGCNEKYHLQCSGIDYIEEDYYSIDIETDSFYCEACSE